MTVKPKFELLEDRIVLDGADPEVTLAGPEGGVELGQQDVNYTLTFDNTGTESGYVPYAELIIPTSGGDGEGDGPTFDSASFLGAPITTTELTFDAAGEVEHPFLTNPDGSPLIVMGGLPGDTFVVFELPYGSFSPGNPPVDIDVVIDFSDQADLGATPTFQALGGFALGCDPLDNPVDDAPLRGAIDTLVQDPSLFTVGKTSTAPEFENATGPSYVYQYILTVDIAPNQTLTDFSLTDNLPPEAVYMGNVVISGGTGGVVSSAPTVGDQVQPGEQFIVDFDAVSGSVTVTFDYYISNDPSDSPDPTNDPATGAPTTFENTVTGQGLWTPLDPDDAPITASDSAMVTTTASTLAIQKSNVLVVDNNAPGNSPGDVYEFTLNVQVSDYFSFGDLNVEDILGDGWDYVDNSAEFFVTEEAGNLGSAASPISLAGNESVSDNTPGTGETTILWDISQAMIDAGGDGLLVGDIAADGSSSGTQTTVTVTYQAAILDAYANAGGVTGDLFIGQGDNLGNDATVSGNVRANPDDGGDPNVPTANNLEEVSLSEVIIPRGGIESKEVFALNGDTNPPSDIVIAAGDQVTFSIIYRAPIAVFENFRIEDNMPQLVFDAESEFDTLMTWDDSPLDRTAPPPAGMAYFGSATSPDILAAVPTIDTDGPNNGLIFEFGNFAAATPEEAVIEILFTATVQDALFADDLLLTNQATAFETNSFGEEIFTTAIAQFDYGEPKLNISKGVVASSSADPETTLSGNVGLTGVNVPDTSVPRFSGQVTSGTKDDSPIDVNANIENIDAGDIVTFAIVIENEGSAPNGAFNVTVQDTLPDGFEIPGTGLNLAITDGSGSTTPIPFTLPDGTPANDADLFSASGIMLTDDAPLQGAISQFNETSGENVIVITYDLLVSDDVPVNATLTNTAGIATYNAFEGNGLPLDPNGPENRVVDPITDDATATTENISITKTIDDRQFDGDITGRNANEVAVGEDFEFVIRLDVPEGELDNFVISDTVLNGGLTLISAEIETMGANFSNTGMPLLVQGSTTNANAAGTFWSFDFGDLTNAGDNDATNDFIEIRVFARASDDDVGSANHFMRNEARVQYDNTNGDTFSQTDRAVARLIEPNLDLEKTASPGVVEAGDTVTYQVAIENQQGFRDAPAFDLTMSDVLDPVLTLDPSSIQVFLNGNLQTIDGTNFAVTSDAVTVPNSLSVFIDRIDQDDTVVIQYEADVAQSIPAGLTIPNTANLVFDSTPEDDSAGPDGDDREYSLSDDAEVVAAQPEITKDIVSGSSSYGETTDPELGIGETITYEFTVEIPEGSIDDVVLVDTLPAGLEYVDSEVVRVGTALNTNIVGSTLVAGNAGVNAGANTTFDFGDLTNTFDNVSDASDEIVVRITARVTDVGAASNNANLTNVGVLSFTDGDGNPDSVQDDATITVVEPDVVLAKSVDPTIVDAGDTVEYTLVATNEGDGPAYDMRITDDLVGVDVTAVGSATIVITDSGGAVYTPTELPTFTFGGAFPLEIIVPDLPAGHVVTITYDAVVQDTALFSSTFVNTAQIARYDSNPLGDADTPPADPDEEERTYTGTPVTASFDTPDASVEKELLSSNNTDTASNELNIGEEVVYELTITVPEGRAGIVLQDDLPTGLLAQSATVVSIGDDVLDTSSNLVAGDTEADVNITISGARDQVLFNFGTVLVDGEPDNPLAVDTEIVVRVTAIVEDNAAIDAGDMLTNTATLTVSDPVGGGVLDTDTDTETVTVVEPDLEIEKTGPVAADPGDFESYSITITNTGDGPAYDTNITDPFDDPNLLYQNGSVQVFLNNVLMPVQPTVVEPAPSELSGFQVQDLDLQPGDEIRVDFQVQINPLAPDAQTFTNTATVEYDSIEGNPTDVDGNPLGRDDSDTDDHNVATVPLIEKAPIASQFSETVSEAGDDPFNLAIGEEVTFQYLITLPEIELDSVIAIDTLPTGMEFVSASVVNVNGTGQSGVLTATQDVLNPNIVTFDFGGMTNPSDGSIGADDILEFQVVARITELSSAGDTLTNSVQLDVTPTGGPAFDTQTTTADVNIVEPELRIEKTGPLALSPGGPAGTFTITVTNDGVDGAEGPAYDLDISDALPVGMTLDTGSFSFEDGNGNTLTPENFTANASSFLAEFAVLDVDEDIVITYSASLDVGATPLATFENTASADFFSAPDDLLGEDGNPVAEDYTPVTDEHIVSTIPTLDKDATSTGTAETPDNADADTELDATIGETITYDLTLTLPEIPMETVALTDTLPAGLSFVSAEITAIGSEIMVSSSTDLTAINAAATINTVGPATTITLSDVINTYVDGTILEAQDAITIQITARVEDVGTNVGSLPNTQLTNTASLQITPEGEPALTPVEATETIEVVEPSLDIEKTGTVAVNPGDPIDYEVTITNNGTSPAFDVIVTDSVADSFIMFESGSVTIELDGIDITGQIDVTETATGFTFELDDNVTGDPIPIPVGIDLVVRYSADLDSNAPDAESFLNTATVNYDGLPGDPVDENGDPVDDRDYTNSDENAVATVPFITKTPFASNFAETSETPFELAIGEEVTYRYQLYLPEISMDSVLFEDNFDAGLEFVRVDSVAYGTGMTDLASAAPGSPTVSEISPTQFILDFGGIINPPEPAVPVIGPEDIITVDVVMRVVNDGAASAGDVVTNTATLEVNPTAGNPLNQVTANAEVTIVEPLLEIEKSGPATADPGDTVTYTIEVTNIGDPAGAGPAYDVEIEDILPAGLTLNTGSLSFSIAPVSQSATATGFEAEFAVIEPNETLTITYTVQMGAGVTPVTSFQNTATAAYDSAPGDPVDPDTGEPVEQTYTPVTDDHVLSTGPSLDKIAISSEFSETPFDDDGDGLPDLAIGEAMTYRLVVTLPDTTMDSVVLTDNLPTGMEFVSGSVATIGSEITVNGTTDVSNVGSDVIVSLTDVVNVFGSGNITTAEDAIIIEIVARATDVATNVEGTPLTNTASLVVTPEGESPLDPVTDTQTVEIIEPNVAVTKDVSETEPDLGDTITYTFEISNDPTATSAAFNTVLTDNLPSGLSLTGTVTLSDPMLGTVSPSSGAGSTTLIVTVPVLEPGETLVVEADVFVGYATAVLEDVINTGSIAAGTTPIPNDPNGRTYVEEDAASFEAQPTPFPVGERPVRAIGGIDDAQFLPIILIDPIFTGTAEPGSNVTVNLYRQNGELDYVRNIVADTGGHWIAIFPRVELNPVADDFHEEFAGSILFDAPVKYIDTEQSDLFLRSVDQRELSIGSDLLDEAYTLGVSVDRPSTLPQDSSIHNTRTYFAPAHVGEIYGVDDVLSVDEIFQDIAFRTVEEMYEGTANPLGISLNRFNYEFLSSQTAVPGAQ